MTETELPQDPYFAELIQAYEARMAGALDQAAALLHGVLVRCPEEPRALAQLGNLFVHVGRYEEGAALLARVVATAPFPEAMHDLGVAYLRLGRLGEAQHVFEQALAIGANLPSTWIALAYLWLRRDDLQASLACFQQGVMAGGEHWPTALTGVVHTAMKLGQWELAGRNLGRLCDLVGQPGVLIEPFPLLSLPVPVALHRAAARRATEDSRRSVVGEPFRFHAEVPARLRVGYLAAEFHRHPTAFLLAEVLERHDRTAVEVFAISYGPDDGSDVRQRIRAGVDHFHDVGTLSDEAAAALIHGLGIHVLVDLKGFTQDLRAGILLRRPAPVVAHWLGYPGPLGGLVDAIIGDAVVTPPGCEADYDEEMVRLPVCYQPNDATRPVGPRPGREALGLPAGAVVFCGFNATYKLNADVWGRWMAVLSAVEDSVLWLLEPHPQARQALADAAAAAGIEPSRLVFAPIVPNTDQATHLARQQAADLFLDTWPYGAHTTASDALWAGLPVLTWAGQGFAARVAASLLHHLGLEELVAADADDYVARAVALGRDRAALAAVRAKLADARTRPGGPFDATATARALEGAYRDLYEGWVAKAGA